MCFPDGPHPARLAQRWGTSAQLHCTAASLSPFPYPQRGVVYKAERQSPALRAAVAMQ